MKLLLVLMNLVFLQVLNTGTSKIILTQDTNENEHTIHHHHYAHEQNIQEELQKNYSQSIEPRFSTDNLNNNLFGERRNFRRNQQGAQEINIIPKKSNKGVTKTKARRKKHARHNNFEEDKNIHTFEETHEHIHHNDKKFKIFEDQQQSQSTEHHQLQFYEPQQEGSEHLPHIEEHEEKHEKIKIKHHHHHHHHNHVKEIIKKVPEPYPVEKIVHVPVEKIVEKIVHVPKPYPVEKIIEKIVNVPVEKVVHIPKPYPVEKIIEKKVPYPVEKIVEKIIEKKIPYRVEKIIEKKIPYPVEKVVHVPIEKIVEKIVHVPKIVEKKVPYPVEKIVEKIVHVPKVIEKVVHVPIEKIIEKVVHVPQPYPVEKIVKKIIHVPKPYPVVSPVPYPVEVKVPIHIEKPVPYPVEKKVPVPYKVEVEKKVPVYIHSHAPYKFEKADEHSYQDHEQYDKFHENHEKIENQESKYHSQIKHISHLDLSDQPSNHNSHHRTPVSSKYATPIINSGSAGVIRAELLRQQLHNFGYQKQPSSVSEPFIAENRPMIVGNKGLSSEKNSDAVQNLDNTHSEQSPDSPASITGSMDLQSQASSYIPQFLPQISSVALPFQLFHLQPMPFQNAGEYQSVASFHSEVSDS